jgi:aldehyde:ferredoxin oxidoreductase
MKISAVKFQTQAIERNGKMTQKSDGFPGYVGQILRVDLSKRQWTIEDIDTEIIKKFIGGMGIGAKILFEETGPHTGPLDPDNILILSPGLLNGTNAPTAYRTEITTKSPLTGIIGSGNFGGLFGSMMRKAGYEQIVIKGRAADPTYLIVDEGRIELKSARHLWGKNTFETISGIKNAIGNNFSVMAIGPAGENLVKFACPVIDFSHAPGRSHAGCVMGSKNLKAIAVRGSRKIPIPLLDSFKETCKEIEERIKAYPEKGMRTKIASTGKAFYAANKGILGSRNYQTGILPKSNVIWRPEENQNYLVKGPTYCGDCPQSATYGCHMTVNVQSGKYKGLYMEGAAFSHPIYQWGSKCGIETFPGMMKCREICNQYGMDQCGPIPFALELFQRGIITKNDLGERELKWGDEDDIIQLLSDIAHRRGLGNILAEGSVEAAKRIGRGAHNFALTIKGLEVFLGADPRGAGEARNLGHITCLRGGDDLKNTHVIVENIPGWAKKQGMEDEEYISWLLNSLDMFDDVKTTIYGNLPNVEIPSRSPKGIAMTTKWYEDMTAIGNSLGVCLFAINVTNAIGITYSSRLIESYLGVNFPPEELIKAGERIVNLLKAYTVREGKTRQDDNFPARFYDENLNNGTPEGGPIIPRTHRLPARQLLSAQGLGPIHG